MAAIRAIFLDLGWTLAYPRTSIWEIFADLSAGAGAPMAAEACEQLMRGLSAATQPQAEERFHAGAQYPDSDEAFAGLFIQMGRLIFAQAGVTSGHDELMQRFLRAFWTEDNWCLFPEVAAVLGELRRRGLRLGILSNAPSDLPRFLERLGIASAIDFTVVSALEGVKKPDRRIFAAALARAGVTPSEALHVGDMYMEDIVGGRAAGLKTLLMERGRRALFPSFRESEGRGLGPDVVVSDLLQVLDRIG